MYVYVIVLYKYEYYIYTLGNILLTTQKSIIQNPWPYDIDIDIDIHTLRTQRPRGIRKGKLGRE